jgi:hypothetical protein
VTHPHEALGQPAQFFEVRPQPLRGRGELEVDTAVGQPVERLVGERRQLPRAHLGVLLDPDQVEGPVVGVTRGSHDRAVRPRLENVAGNPLDFVIEVARPSRDLTRGRVPHALVVSDANTVVARRARTEHGRARERSRCRASTSIAGAARRRFAAAERERICGGDH